MLLDKLSIFEFSETRQPEVSPWCTARHFATQRAMTSPRVHRVGRTRTVVLQDPVKYAQLLKRKAPAIDISSLRYLVPLATRQTIQLKATVLYKFPAQFSVSDMCVNLEGHEWIDVEETKYFNKKELESLKLQAEDVLEAVNLSRESIAQKIGSAAVMFELENTEAKLISIADCRFHSNYVPNANDLLKIIHRDYDENHMSVLSEFNNVQQLLDIVDLLVGYLELTPEASRDAHLLLKQERAILVLLDAVFCVFSVNGQIHSPLAERIAAAVTENPSLQKEIQMLIIQIQVGNCKPYSKDDYYQLLDCFLKASNAKELQDFENCAGELHDKSIEKELFWNPKVGSRVSCESGMRIGISSANASDNWTNVKLRGGRVVNICVNLDGQPPVAAECCLLSTPKIILESFDWLDGEPKTRTKEYKTQEDMLDFFNVSDNSDPFRLMKYALIFVGIVKNSSKSALDCIQRFTKGQGLKVRVYNNGPSRSGFASSSAVSRNMLKVLYKASNQEEISENDIELGSMVLLFENIMGLKSGRQDVDGLLANGLKDLHYFPTEKFVIPKINILHDFNDKQLHESLLIVDSGIPRSADLGRSRGLNMRHWALLSRDAVRFVALRKSYRLHSELVQSFQRSDFAALGQYMLDYMHLRELIDEGATMSLHDAAFGDKVLRLLFDPLKEQGLVHGGMFTGAMGGGVAMLVVTELGKELVQSQSQSQLQSKIETALQELKQLELPNGTCPFRHLRVFDYTVNTAGVSYTCQ